MHPYWHNLFRRLQGDHDAGPVPGPVVRTGAAAASQIYGLGAGLRRALFARGVLRAKKLPAPVVSVGNLTVGGTGKTPVAACLARLWRNRGQRVAILSRGYGGQSRNVACISDGRQTYKKPPEVGEEPYWLARTLPGVAVARQVDHGHDVPTDLPGPLLDRSDIVLGPHHRPNLSSVSLASSTPRRGLERTGFPVRRASASSIRAMEPCARTMTSDPSMTRRKWSATIRSWRPGSLAVRASKAPAHNRDVSATSRPARCARR